MTRLLKKLSNEVSSKNLEGVQISAIKYSIKLGLDLQKSFPEMADDFREGMSLKEISRRHRISEINGFSESTSIQGVRNALKGYDSGSDFFNCPSYDGMIPLDEYRALAKGHKVDCAIALSDLMKIEKRGIYGLSLDQRIKNSRKGAKSQMKKKSGIHAQTSKGHQEAGRLGVKARGLMPWSDDEKLFVLERVTSPREEYQRGARFATKKIAQELNEFYHDGNLIRTSIAVGRFIRDYNKGLRDF